MAEAGKVLLCSTLPVCYSASVLPLLLLLLLCRCTMCLTHALLRCVCVFFVRQVAAHRHIYDNVRTAPCERRHLRLSSLQTEFRSESVRRPRDRFLARSSRGLRSSASAPPIPRARTLGSRAAAERVDLELGGSCGNGETSRSLTKIVAVLLLLRGDDSVL